LSVVGSAGGASDSRSVRGFPDAIAPETQTHNLPYELSAFVGREREVAEVTALVASARLVTVTGPGGAGKTRLALRVAHDVVKEFADGVWLVELAGLTEPGLVAQAVAAAVSVREQAGQGLVDTLAEALRGRQLLLVLDNCEHLLDSTGRLVASLLSACPEMRVLATSRKAFGVSWEVHWRMPAMGEETAVRLFVERARQRVPDLALTLSTQQAVGEICRALDGLPLAIELATARMPFLTVEQIAGMLADQRDGVSAGLLGLLASGSRTAVARQRTLRATLDWSHDLLSEPEQILFARLSVFSGRWSLDAASAVGERWNLSRGQVLDALNALVDQSLVTTDHGVDGQARYRLLEPVRQYGLQRLSERGETAAARLAHACYLIELAQTAAPLLQGPDQLEALRWLDEHEHDLRAAIGWLLGHGNADQAADLGWSLWLFWWLRRRLGEGRRWMEQALETKLPPIRRARALFVAGTLACGQADFAWAADRLAESIALFRAENDDQGAAYALSSAGFAAIGRGLRAEGVERLDEGVETALAAGESWAAAFMLCFLATIRREERDAGAAAELAQRGLELSRAIGDREGTAMALYLIASLALEGSNRELAATRFREGLTLAAQVGDATNVVYCLQGLAAAAASTGWPSRGARLWGAAQRLRDSIEPATYVYAPDPADVERRIAVARATLGAAPFDAAWVEGREMTTEAAIAYALAHGSRPPSGGYPAGLTDREVEVMRLIAAGYTNKQIAGALGLGVSTVERHVTHLYAKIGARGRADATAFCLRHGLLNPG
jgi:non-specific serine/threonine protein kinase